MNRFGLLPLVFLLAFLPASNARMRAGADQAAADSRAWIETSNKHAQVLLDVRARFGPEGAGQIGVAGLDREVTSLTPESLRQMRQATAAALARLKSLLEAEQDLRVLVAGLDPRP